MRLTIAILCLIAGTPFASPAGAHQALADDGLDRVAIDPEAAQALVLGSAMKAFILAERQAKECLARYPEPEPCAAITLFGARAAIRVRDLDGLERMIGASSMMELRRDETETLFEYQDYAAKSFMNDGQFEKGAELFRQQLATGIVLFGERAPELASIHHNRGFAYRALDRLNDAEVAYREAIAIRTTLGTEAEPDLASSYSGLSIVLAAMGRIAEAETLLRAALDIRVRYESPTREVVVTMINLASNLERQGRYGEAIPILREAEAMIGGSGLEGSYFHAVLLNNLANVLSQGAAVDEAIAYYEASIAIRQQVLRPGHPDQIMPIINLAQYLRDLGRLEPSITWYREALLLVRYNDPQSPIGIRTLGEAASVLMRLGEFEEARHLLVQAAEGAQTRLTFAPEFDAVAKSELQSASPIFLDLVKTDWELSLLQ